MMRNLFPASDKKGGKCLLWLLLMSLFLSGTAWAQETRIPGTKVSFVFPSQWKYLNTTKVDENSDLYLYCRTEAVSSNGDTALPFLRIYVRRNFPSSVFELAFERYSAQPYQSMTDYVKGLGLPKSGGLGYVGAYTNSKNLKDYQFRMVYFKEGNTAVEFRLETTRATYALMEAEFNGILESMKF